MTLKPSNKKMHISYNFSYDLFKFGLVTPDKYVTDLVTVAKHLTEIFYHVPLLLNSRVKSGFENCNRCLITGTALPHLKNYFDSYLSKLWPGQQNQISPPSLVPACPCVPEWAGH